MIFVNFTGFSLFYCIGFQPISQSAINHGTFVDYELDIIAIFGDIRLFIDIYYGRFV